MTDPADALAARIERFERAADPELIWDPAALAEAEQAMRACAGDRSDAATWRLIGMLHLARYRLDQRTTRDAAVAGAFFAAVAVLDPGRLPEKLRGSSGPPGDSAGTWAGLVEELFRHVDPASYRHVGLLIHALVRRAMARPTREVADRLGQLLLEESMRSPDPSWAPGALEPLGTGLVHLYGLTGDREVIDDAVHVLFRAALSGPVEAAYAGELAAALGLAAPGDEELVRAYLSAAETPPGGQDRSQALLALVDVTQARAAASCADGDLLAFIRVGQCALDFWHEQWAHPAVLAPYAAGLIEWFVITGNERSLEAGMEMLEALHVTPDETARGLGTDPVVRLGLLGDRRRRRYDVTGDLADLDVTVDVLREAARLAPAGHRERPRILDGLANALLRRAVVAGGDPAEAIAAARAAVAAYDGRDPARATSLLLLARALKLELTPQTADEAVAALHDALAAGERLAFRAEAYGLLSEVLRWRAAREGGTEDLHEAVRSARQGVELAVKTSSDHGPVHGTLCRALLARFSAQGDPRDLAEALALAGDGDADLLERLGAALADPPPVDEQLAQAATELALRIADDDMALKLLRFAGQRPWSPGERGEFLLDTALHLGELGRPRIAGEVLERAAAAFEAAGLLARAAYALSRKGAGHEELGEPDRALAAFGRAADAYRDVGETRSEALQLGNMGIVHLQAGDPARAVEHHLRAVALCEGAGLAAEEAGQLGHAAEAYLAAGDPDGAVDCAGRARELYLGLGETESAALALVHAARAAVDQDDLVAAGERIAACAIELEAAGAWEDACRTLDAQAVLLAARGHRTQAAACEIRLVEIVRRKGRRREPADEWYRLAQRRRGLGDVIGARAAFELAEREYESIAHHDGAGSVRYNLGVLSYTEGEPERALEEFGAAAETFVRLRAPAKEAAALTMRASCSVALGGVEDALADLDRALELAAAEGDLEALLTATLGRAALDVELGEPQEAEERLYSALGLAAGDPLKEAVVRDRLAALAARAGDARGQVAALEEALTLFHAGGQARLAALASIKLGFALEERGEFRRARTALEEGLAGLASAPGPRPAGTPFEVVAAMAGDLDADVLSRLATIQLTLGDLSGGRATLTQALSTLRAGGHRGEAATRLENRLRLEEAEAAGDLTTVRHLAEQALTTASPSATASFGTPTEWPPADASATPLGTAVFPEAAARPEGTALPGSAGPPVPTGDPSERSYLLAKLSACCLALGDPAAAYDYAAHGYRLRDERMLDHLRNLGTAARALGRTGEAVEHLSKAVDLARDADSALPARLARSLGLLATALTDQARWEEAARAYEEGLSLLEAPIWRALRAPLLSGRAALHLELGELNEATTRYRQAISLKEELGDTTGLADAYADLSLTHELSGDPAQALPLAERALDLEDAPRSRVLILLALARLTPPERAESLLSEALATAQELGFRAGEAIALRHLGALDLTTASYARARRRLSTAIDLLTDLGHDLELGAAHHHRSMAAAELGDLPNALTDAEHACALGHPPATDRAVHLAVRLNRGLTAWTHAETAKSTALSTVLSARLHRNAAPGTPGQDAPHGVPRDLAEAEHRGLTEVRTLTTAARHTRDPEHAARLLRRAHTAQATLEALWTRMEPLAPDHVALHRPAPLTQADLDFLVGRPDGPIGLLAFHLTEAPPPTRPSETEDDTLIGDGGLNGEDTVIVLAHRTGWPEPRAFPTTVTRALLAAFLRTTNGRRPGLLDIEARRRRAALWRELADRLLAGALAALGDDLTHLHLFPHAELRRVPLHALAPNGRMLLERLPVTYAPSATVLSRLHHRAPARGADSLALGFTPDPAERLVVESEAEDVAGILATRPRTGQDATSGLLNGSWDVVHLACHGVFDDAGPSGPGIRLADGLLTTRRLMTMNVDARLALLSAHEHQPAGTTSGAGVAELGYALLHAGARSAVLTLWPVSPEITRVLMRDLHTRLHHGATPAEALRAAVLGLRELYGSAEPDLWAAYILTGLPR
ncbi:Tetratricopeptide repeat-containing protein [Nonomuraea solani]|uniref:Tetratricopeptide repeat-containing protein n=1 Tax=Nonomuraea solani TaxID=1144553 RepID=A0A1H6E1N6_9ACTN|nr:CHAT domain-containing protein [Nonomuraea solani]SEG91520.1 Tetratricopeptide repeat-containing protein [Nonomuraea solani]